MLRPFDTSRTVWVMGSDPADAIVWRVHVPAISTAEQTKRPGYQRNRVPECWVVDAASETIEVSRRERSVMAAGLATCGHAMYSSLYNREKT
jgi:hypothetical protein